MRLRVFNLILHMAKGTIVCYTKKHMEPIITLFKLLDNNQGPIRIELHFMGQPAGLLDDWARLPKHQFDFWQADKRSIYNFYSNWKNSISIFNHEDFLPCTLSYCNFIWSFWCPLLWTQHRYICKYITINTMCLIFI